MPASKKTKTEKKSESTEEFVKKLAKQDVKRNGLRVRFGFGGHRRKAG
tara:strand:+ start:670 stop:813 length:144 start_codon:yes stop_codon:yes gene_type:complete